jgi:GNAT superfamily N-acetyltransferase
MTLNLSNNSLKLRSISPTDLEQLCEIYGSTREEELKRVPHWSENQKKEFIHQQFTAQHEYYQQNYKGGGFYIIEYDEKVAGRLYLQENFQNNGVRIIDITILPHFQKKGIGRTLLNDILLKAIKLNQPVTIHVENFNPAMHFYNKLGFKKISETNDVYHLLEWKHKK